MHNFINMKVVRGKKTLLHLSNTKVFILQEPVLFSPDHCAFKAAFVKRESFYRLGVMTILYQWKECPLLSTEGH